MRTLCFGLLLTMPLLAHAQTELGALLQAGEPVHFTSTHHGLHNALAGGSIENRGAQALVGYRVGWVLIQQGRTSLHEGPWIAVEHDAQPGSTIQVPDLAIPLDTTASSYYFYVAETTNGDGTQWSADAKAILQEAASHSSTP